MNKESVIDALVTLANGLEKRSKVAQLREIYPYIEAAQRKGLKNSTIVETLNSQGFELTVKSFEMLLYRIRKSGLATEGEAISTAITLQKEGSVQHQPIHLTQNGTRPNAEQQTPPSDGLSGLDKKQRRERLGDQFISAEVTNPLLKRIKDQHQ